MLKTLLLISVISEREHMLSFLEEKFPSLDLICPSFSEAHCLLCVLAVLILQVCLWNGDNLLNKV